MLITGARPGVRTFEHQLRESTERIRVRSHCGSIKVSLSVITNHQTVQTEDLFLMSTTLQCLHTLELPNTHMLDDLPTIQQGTV